MKTDGKIEESLSKGKDFVFQVLVQCHCVSGKDLSAGSAQKKTKFINVGKLSQIFIITQGFLHYYSLSRNAFTGVYFSRRYSPAGASLM